ncbi:golgi nucleotide sugar transporter 3 [Actinidia rufa]|uniref:Golgi nucleotide sugar transporter 3 n=1 Tax=Actinidia rufa TaxID=165716 RepID=A0A7J0E656_9ERIC|nr:golgi nucleotide sugar transporter 3 [Actinidia rufa]
MSNDVENLKDGGPPKSSDSATGSSNSGETQVSLYSGLLQQASVYGIAAGYCLLASLLSIINKWGCSEISLSRGADCSTVLHKCSSCPPFVGGSKL